MMQEERGVWWRIEGCEDMAASQLWDFAGAEGSLNVEGNDVRVLIF